MHQTKITSDSAGDSDFLIYLTLRVLFYDLIIAAGNVVADFCQGQSPKIVINDNFQLIY